VVDGKRATPLGIARGGIVQDYPYPSVPEPAANALWFKTSSDRTDPTQGGNYEATSPLFYQTPLAAGTTQQPLLVPVLQIQTPTGSPARGGNFGAVVSGEALDKNWMQAPTDQKTTFNLVMAVGDSPTRPTRYSYAPVPEFNGGMPNLPVFLEDWESAKRVVSISGSFIQIKRSAYATAPFLSILDTNAGSGGGIFGYPQAYRTISSAYPPGGYLGRSPYYYAPKREWGFDVALLSQLPDLFSQQITTPSAGEPNKFYREVSQDDPWVKTLLCAAAQQTPGTTNYRTYAVDDAKLRPNNCPRLPY